MTPSSMVRMVAASSRSAKARRSSKPSSSARLRSAPDHAKNRSYAVGGGGLPFEMPVIVAGDGAVGRFVLILTVGGDQYAGHHGEEPNAVATISLITSPS